LIHCSIYTVEWRQLNTIFLMIAVFFVVRMNNLDWIIITLIFYNPPKWRVNKPHNIVQEICVKDVENDWHNKIYDLCYDIVNSVTAYNNLFISIYYYYIRWLSFKLQWRVYDISMVYLILIRSEFLIKYAC